MADRSGSRSGSEPDSVWYRLGYALERTRGTASHPGRLKSLAERGLDSGRRGPRRSTGKDEGTGERRPARRDRDGAGSGDGDPVALLLAAGAGTLAARVLDLWPARRRPGVGGLVRAGLAGAGAALGRQLLRPVLDGGRLGMDEEMAEAVAAGAARGLLYAAVVEPRLRGTPAVRGALYGGIEYAVSPWGGLTRLLGRKAPHRKLPFLAPLFDGYDPADDTLADHVAFAVALAVLYGGAGEDDEA